MKKRLAFLLLTTAFALSNIGCLSKYNSENKDIAPHVTQTPTTQPTVTQAPIKSYGEQPSPGSIVKTDSLRFAVLADSRGIDNGVDSKIVKRILSEVKQLSPQPEFIIMPGDLTDGSKTYKGIKSQLDYFKQIISKYYPINFFYPGIGNHEMRAGENGEKAFSETFKEFNANFLKGYHRTSYYFDAGDTRVFMLNSNHPGETHKITGKQLNWLKSNISKGSKHNIILFHEPPYPTGAEAGNSLDSYPAARDAFWEVVDKAGNTIVICGHEHNYSRRLIDSSFNETIGGKHYEFKKGIYQIISGGFGAPLYPQYTSKKNMIVAPIPEYHITIVDVNDSGISIQAVNIDGKIIDSFQVK